MCCAALLETVTEQFARCSTQGEEQSSSDDNLQIQRLKESLERRRLGLAFGFRRCLRSWGFAERIHRNRRVLDEGDLEMLCLRWCAQGHAVADAGLHKRIRER